MVHDLPIGRALLRFRRLNNIKQEHLAESLSVSQGTVSRWESGSHLPDIHKHERIIALIAAHSDNDGDAALKRLIATSTLAVHLVCDATHNLLAISPARAATFAGGSAPYIGTSLWGYASPAIHQAEAGLAERGWFERMFQTLTFVTDDNGSEHVPVRPSVVRWETIQLADGRVGRITTTLSSYA